MTELSPAAKAVLNAANSRNSYGPDDCLNESRWIAAAALRAAAEQVVPASLPWHRATCNPLAGQIRTELLAIAAELDPTTDTSGGHSSNE